VNSRTNTGVGADPMYETRTNGGDKMSSLITLNSERGPLGSQIFVGGFI
jgi:hypothetical protein